MIWNVVFTPWVSSKGMLLIWPNRAALFFSHDLCVPIFKLLCSPDCPWPFGHVAHVLLAGQLHLLWKSFPFLRPGSNTASFMKPSLNFNRIRGDFSLSFKFLLNDMVQGTVTPLSVYYALSTVSALSKYFKNIYWMIPFYIYKLTLFPIYTTSFMFCFLFSFLILD